MDDVEVRGREYSVRWREGRRDLRPIETLKIGTRTYHAPLYSRTQRVVRPRARRSRAGYRHKRTDDGLGNGYLLDACAAGHDCRGDRQATRTGRFEIGRA